MQSRINKLLLIILLSTAASCRKAAICDCFKGTGDDMTEDRTSQPFHSVDIYKKADINVHYSSVYKVKVTAGEHVINKLSTEVRDGVLYIENKNRCNWVRDFRNKFIVDIYTPELDTLQIHDSPGSISYLDIVPSIRYKFESRNSSGQYDLKLDAGTAHIALQSGPASLNATGKCGVAYLWNSGTGFYDLREMVADDIYATNLGTNDMYLNSLKRLYASLKYSGNIYYKDGVPDLLLTDEGTGSFIVFH